ncbi:hypothetical protein CIK05_15390 [Bdellovibrio sp. qaytius]|nr:hypothetical protein CIK05_15390 [Bdellovibrio sp. qaytius]
MKVTQGSETNIFEYSDYRKYLADYYTQKKINNPGYSHRVFARQAGLSSPSHLLMIIKGERNLSIKTISKFSDGLKLSIKEKRYFELMVLYTQTNELELKARYFGEIISMKATISGLYKLEKDKFDFLSQWYFVAIYVLIGLTVFKADPQWISRRLGNKITPTQAKDTLEKLLKLNMIETDPLNGFKQASGAVTVADDTRSIAVFEYHQSMIRLAFEALKHKPLTEREMAGATISIPKDKLPEIKEKIRAFRKEINQLASSYQDSEEVYQLNIQLFALSEEI